MTYFSKRLKAHRLKKDISASEMARLIGVPITTYRDWEAGREIQGQPYLKISEALGISLYELMTVENPKEKIVQGIEMIESILKMIKVSL